jgi:hypothetical protein
MNTTETPHPLQDTGPTLRSERLEKQRLTLEDYLNNDMRSPGCITVLEEKPIHRTLAYLMAAGRTRIECAQVLELSLTTISTIAKQPFFQKRLKEITDATGKDMVKSFLENEVLPSLEVLRTIRDDVNQKGPTRVIAADKILDRFLGKPMVHVESKTNLNIHTAAASAEDVQRELGTINEELAARGVVLSNGKN